MKWMSKYFINGIIVTVPFVITVFVIIKIFECAEGILGKFLPVYFPGFGLVAVFSLIVLIGWLSSHWALRWVLDLGERLVGTIPIVKFIYNSVKQLSTAVFESQHLFKQAVLVPYPHPGVKAVGFVMPSLSESFTDKLPDEEYVCVFIPFSMNMTAGSNIIVLKRDVIYLDISGESALQYILSAGAIMPRSNDMPKG